jgi:hypothetical protein
MIKTLFEVDLNLSFLSILFSNFLNAYYCDGLMYFGVA